MGTFRVVKSYKDGHVGLRASMKGDGRGDSIKMDAGTDLSSIRARDLAQALIEEANRADAKVATKKASDERRQKYRDREVAAGRMKIIQFR